MHYRELKIPEHVELKQWLISIYELKSLASELSYFAVPNGYIGIMINLSGITFLDNEEKVAPSSAISGMLLHSLKVKHNVNTWEICLVFNPVYLQLLLKDKMTHFTTGKVFELTDFISQSKVDRLKEKLFFAKNDLETITIITEFLKPIFLNKVINQNALELYRLIHHNKAINVNDLSEYFNVSATSIRNWSLDHIGISPKELIQIKRFNRILTAQDIKAALDVAYELNYYDQSHFIHFFKQKSGMKPTDYFKNKKFTFDFYNFKRWKID